MRWALFQQVMHKLASVRELDPRRDAARYAEQLLLVRPRLFAAIEGGPESVAARMAALTTAGDHLREVTCAKFAGCRPTSTSSSARWRSRP